MSAHVVSQVLRQLKEKFGLCEKGPLQAFINAIQQTDCYKEKVYAFDKAEAVLSQVRATDTLWPHKSDMK